MNPIKTKDCSIYFNKDCYDVLKTYIERSNPSRIVILVDSNTKRFCLKKLQSHLLVDVKIDIIMIEAGEEYKTIDTCVEVWNQLTEIGVDRKSLMINLGGGVITDLGGFVASTYKRGIDYINIPTTLLAMVDASIGGKTGVDLENLKNLIGLVKSGSMVLIDTSYLETLPENQLMSGYSEMLKHGLIFDRNYWDSLKDKTDFKKLDTLIHRSVEIKHAVVTEDPNELGLRKTLNYGHTLGHAIESYFLENTSADSLLHGEAIAIGMIMESYISNKQLGLTDTDLNDITNTFKRLFKGIDMDKDDFSEIIKLLKYDKKNERGNVNFVLLENIGKPKIDCMVKDQLLIEAMEYYLGHK